MALKNYHSLLIAAFIVTSLAACAPEGQAQEGQAQEIRPALTQTIEILTPVDSIGEVALEEGVETVVETPTPNNIQLYVEQLKTKQADYTATPILSLTPEDAEANNMHEYCIQRAKEVGINLENLAESTNLWLSRHPSIATFQEEFENNFPNPDNVNKTMIIVGLDGTNNDQERSRRVVSDGGWEILGWAEAIYQRADGQYQMVLLPIGAHSSELDKAWMKMPGTGTPFFDNSGWGKVSYDIDFFAERGVSLENEHIFHYARNKHYFGPGALLRFATTYPSERLSANDGGIDIIHRCSEQELAEFRITGDPSCYDYFWLDSKQPELKKYYLWPFVTYNFLSKLEHYDGEQFHSEFMDWFESYTTNRQPFPKNW